MSSGVWKKKLEEWLDTNLLDQLLPEVTALRGVRQPEEFHSEGDVFTHTLLAVRAVDSLSDKRVFWAVLLHDIGKASTTKLVNGRLRAFGHHIEGAKMVPGILQRFDLGHLSDEVFWLVKHHGFMLSWGQNLTTLTRKQKRFCNHPLFGLLVEVATADGEASLGNSKKLEMLNRIVILCNSD